MHSQTVYSEVEPLVSVVICNFNSEEYLERCLLSLQNGSYKRIEVVLVNDCSEGDDSIIVEKYKKKLNIVYVKNSVNIGLLQSRLEGVRNSSGEYITFLDADDELSVDFVRNNVKEVLLNKADLLRCHLSIKTQDSTCKFIRNHITQKKLNLGDRGLEFLLKQEGRDWTLHTVCGGIYKRSLFDKALPELQSLQYRVSMCEDVLLSVLLYFYSQNTCSSSYVNDVYYYWKHGSNMTGDVRAARKSIESIKQVKEFLINFFLNKKLEKFVVYIENWMCAYEFMWLEMMREANRESLKQTEKGRSILSILVEAPFFSASYRFDFDKIEEIKKKIVDPSISLVSFDLFDTLTKRKVYSPSDLFNLLEKKAIDLLAIHDIINFKQLRIEAEKKARAKSRFEEISIDEIYTELNLVLRLPQDKLDKLKSEEKSLEVEISQARNFSLDLLHLARYAGKKVVVISDMYLPSETLRLILRKHKIEIDFLYVSSEIKKCKSTGNLYKYVQKEVGVDFENWLHIGDNVHSDYEMSKRIGITPIHLPSVKELIEKNTFLTKTNCFSTENVSNEMGLSLVFANMANVLYDDPFSNQVEKEFFKSPANVGILPLACHLISLASWLKSELEKSSIDTIHFLARDGYMPKKVFDFLFSSDNYKTYYTHLNRKTLLPLQIESDRDLITLVSLINYKGISSLDVYPTLENLLTFDSYEDYCIFLKKTKFYDKRFVDNFDFLNFIDAVVKPNLNKLKIKTIRERILKRIQEKISTKTAIFDVGYSCRTETCLKKYYPSVEFLSLSVGLLPPNSLIRSNLFNIGIEPFFREKLELTGSMRELMLSTSDDSVDEALIYEKNDKAITSIKKSSSYKEQYIMRMIHENLMQSLANLKDYSNALQMFPGDLNVFYEKWLKNPSADSLELFSHIRIEDKQSKDWDGKATAEHWRYSTYSPADNNNNCSLARNYKNFPIWKKALLMYLTDREMFIIKTSRKLSKHPIIFKFSRSIYRALKKKYKIKFRIKDEK